MDSQDAIDVILKSHRLTLLAEKIETAQKHLQRAQDTMEALPEGTGEEFPAALDAFSQIGNQSRRLPTPSVVRNEARSVREPIDVLTDSEIDDLMDEADSAREAEAVHWELQRRQDGEIA